MKLNRKNTVKILLILFLLVIFAITRYYHSFYDQSIGYGSGDAYRVILSARNLDKDYNELYLFSYFYRIFFELTKIPYYYLSYYITPFLGLVIILLLFDLIRIKLGFITAFLASLVLILNPYLAYYSTEPSKEIFVLFFVITSLYTLVKFKYYRTKDWLYLSFFFFSIGIAFYHSTLLFLPFYLLLVVFSMDKNNSIWQLSLSLLKISVIFAFLIILLVGPLYTIKQIKVTKNLEIKEESLKSDVDKQGNIFQRQIGSMSYALTKDQSKLGIANLYSGINSFILNRTEVVYLFLFWIIISIVLFIRKKESINLVLSLLIVYIFLVIGMQWLTYSHGSRYPQYVVYFLLLTTGLALNWMLFHIKSKKIRTFLSTIVILSIVFMFNPFLKVDAYRNIYKPQLEIGIRMRSHHILLDNNHQIIYLGWPSTTLSLLENYDIKNDQILHKFGWDSVNLDTISSQNYIDSNKIAYFIFDENGSDYFNSNKIVYESLQRNYALELIINGSKTKIYKLTRNY